jgi:hypothetical protein
MVGVADRLEMLVEGRVERGEPELRGGGLEWEWVDEEGRVTFDPLGVPPSASRAAISALI